MIEHMNKDEELRRLADSIKLVLKESHWPDEVKADILNMTTRFLLIIMGTVHAGFVDEVIAFSEFLQERASTLKKKCEEEMIKSRRDKIKVVPDGESDPFSGQTH